MNFRRTFLAILIAAAPLSAATLRVGPGEAFASIQTAVDTASPGDVIQVAPGIYQENVVVNKSPLALEGARSADDARGRVTGAPNPAVESIVHPVSGSALDLASGDGTISVSGFSFIATAPTTADAVVIASGAALVNFTWTHNHTQAAAGSSGSALALHTGAVNATVTENVFVAAETSQAVVFLSGSHAFHGLRFSNNHVLREGAPGFTGFKVDGDRNLGTSPLRAAALIGNRFIGHAVGLDAGARSLSSVTISGNTFQDNSVGMAAGPRDSSLHGNTWISNTICGLKLSAFGNTADAAYGASGNTIEENQFESNGTDLVCDDQAPGALEDHVIRRNRFLSATVVSNNDPGAVIPAASNYWGAPDGPGGSAPGGGGALTGAGGVTFDPFYADSAMTALVTESSVLTGTTTLEAGQSITGGDLSLATGALLTLHEGATLDVETLGMPAGSSVVIRRGSAMIGRIEMEPDAVLDVVDGDLSLDPAGDGSYHTISGSFTFFNCLGSLQLNGNTSFSGSTLGLASDIHVLPGSTMLVLGSLILDGCRVDSTGTFSLLVNSGATFQMKRCEVKGAAVSLVGSDVTLRDNQFTSSSVTVFSTVNGAKIQHNVFNGGLGLLNILPGAVVTTSLEGWGNVSSLPAVQNEIAMSFRAPVDPTRTLDSEGNLFVQPGDFVNVGMDVSKLNAKTQAVETILGFCTDYLTVDALLPSTTWSNGLYQVSDESETIGKVNTAVGLGFSFPDPDGTTTDSPVADIRMLAEPVEGRTRVFFRSKAPDDHPLIDTRLTVSAGGVPAFKEHPFVRNTPTLTVDGTAPVFGAGATAVQTQESTVVNVLVSGVLTRIGTVTLTFDVTDALAGIDESDVWAELTGTPGTILGTPAGSTLVEIDGVTYSRRTFTFSISSATPDGVYDVNAHAMDRSGNSATLAVGALEVAKNRISATVQPEGLVSTTLSRDVSFSATDSSGAVLATWTVPVSFTSGLGNVVLDRVPDGTVRLSAKMAWNLRVRESVTLDAQRWASASFTGARMLRGGDFTGDNIINLGDYNVMRAVFPGVATAPDITGEGFVNLADYNILRTNWLTAGEPE